MLTCGGVRGADDVLFRSTSLLLGIYSSPIPTMMMMMVMMTMMGLVARAPLAIQANKCEIVVHAKFALNACFKMCSKPL